MKKYFYLSILALFFFACKKQEGSSSQASVFTDYISNVKAYLKANLDSTDYAKADFNNTAVSKEPNAYYLRIAFLNKKIDHDFILLQTDSLGHCSSGKFVHIKRDSANKKAFNGRILARSFQHTTTQHIAIVNDIATEVACPDDPIAEESIDEDNPEDGCDIVPGYPGGSGGGSSETLPEVVVIGYENNPNGTSSNGITFSDYIALSALIADSGYGVNGSATAVYSPINVPPSASPATKVLPNVTVKYDASSSRPGINVNAFMKCFSMIPDASSTCSVTIFTDLPVDDNPSYIFNVLTGATGHCFLQLTKTNGTQSVTQIIGKTTSKAVAILGVSVQGKIVDNTAHKYNASLTMNITPAQLQTEINAVTAIGSAPQYDMWENNCVDYALGILNQVRPADPLQIVMLKDVTSGDSYSTPQGLYTALDQMKQANGPEAKNIAVDLKQNAGTSHGACN